MAGKKTSQCASVCTWCGALVRRHAALLLAALGAAPDHHLAQLLAIFTHRRSHLCQLLNLKGRVELTVSQRNAAHAPQDQQDAVLDYKDTSSDEEMEVEQYQSDSAHSWNESDESEHSSDGE
ncbi:hypothetical protein O3G_MSEX000142 [Manduca sexta]|nr:hypothetical protein O3G_MSEX000142 [Manduca sexta]